MRGSGTTNTLAAPIRHRDHPPKTRRKCGDSDQILQSPSGRGDLNRHRPGNRVRRQAPRTPPDSAPTKVPPRCRRRKTGHSGEPTTLPIPFANFANFFHASNSKFFNHLQPSPLSPPPPSACPPDTICLRGGFARANLPRGKRIPNMMFGPPSVNSSVLNKASPNFRTSMFGIGSSRNKARSGSM
jgi:hypothetical protein